MKRNRENYNISSQSKLVSFSSRKTGRLKRGRERVKKRVGEVVGEGGGVSWRLRKSEDNVAFYAWVARVLSEGFHFLAIKTDLNQCLQCCVCYVCVWVCVCCTHSLLAGGSCCCSCCLS